jgi:hypothetical protein
MMDFRRSKASMEADEEISLLPVKGGHGPIEYL